LRPSFFCPILFDNKKQVFIKSSSPAEETIVEGIANAPKAFLGLFTGANFGKMLVRLGPDRVS
jgi:NADPH-dependent curcumin reductase CurA